MAKKFSSLTPANQVVVVDHVATAMGYSALLPDGVTPNPETKRQFVLRLAEEWIVQRALDHRANVARLQGESDADL